MSEEHHHATGGPGAPDSEALGRVVVTGAGRGLGLEFTRQCLERGDRVFATVRAPDRAEALTELADAAQGRLHILALDVADPASIEAFSTELAAQSDGIELLVNNAGINGKSVPEARRNLSFGSLEPAGMLEMYRVNAVGPALVTQALAGLLEAGHEPRVAHVSSWLGSITKKRGGGNYAYGASKAALNMIGRAMAHDLIERGIVTLMLNPGWVQTDMGGPRASLTPEESVRGMLRVIAAADRSFNSGFFQWDGTEHPW